MKTNLSQHQHLRNAAILWILVGTLLGVRGSLWILANFHSHLLLFIIIPISVVLGIIKGLLLLRLSAIRVIARINKFDEQTPFWMTFNPSTYLLIIGMMVFGIICRVAGNYWHFMGFIGILYLIVGVAMIAGSRSYLSCSALHTT